MSMHFIVSISVTDHIRISYYAKKENVITAWGALEGENTIMIGFPDYIGIPICVTNSLLGLIGIFPDLNSNLSVDFLCYQSIWDTLNCIFMRLDRGRTMFKTYARK